MTTDPAFRRRVAREAGAMVDHVDPSPGAVTEVVRRGRRQQLINRLSTTIAVVVVVAGAATGVAAWFGASPPPEVTIASSPHTEEPAPPSSPSVESTSTDGQVLSACEPTSEVDTLTLVEPDGDRPALSAMENALADNPDDEFMVAELQDQGVSRADALHQMYAQVVGRRLIDDVQGLPGWVEGAIALPLQGEPFRLSFSGAVPDDFDPNDYDLGSYGLVVTTGSAGLDDDAMYAAYIAAEEVGMRTVSAAGDEVTGTARIEVIDATPEQVAAWEAAVDDPSRWCLVRATPTQACDASVVTAAEERAAGQGDILELGDDPTTRDQARQVERSYLGLTLDDARRKAKREGRQVRTVVEEGVLLGANGDSVPGRISLTICQGVVVESDVET